jgi:RHS repeat-associated protein
MRSPLRRALAATLVFQLLAGPLLLPIPSAHGIGPAISPLTFATIANMLAMYLRRQQEAQDSLEDFRRQVEGGASMQPSWMVMDHPFRLNLHAPLSGNQCGSPYGATYDVPFGSYNGSGLLGLYQEPDAAGQGIVAQSFSRGSFIDLLAPNGESAIAGWRFEPLGQLVRSVEVAYHTVGVSPFPNAAYQHCWYVIRYRYLGPSGPMQFQAEGVERTAQATIVVTEPSASLCTSNAIAADAAGKIPEPRYFRSTSGQVRLDLADRENPVLRYPDGSVETFAPGAMMDHAQYEPFFKYSMGSSYLHRRSWTTAQRIDSDRKVTRYVLAPPTPGQMSQQRAREDRRQQAEREALDALAELQRRASEPSASSLSRAGGASLAAIGSRVLALGEAAPVADYLPMRVDVIDPNGRKTAYLRDEAGRVREIRQEGVGGVEQVWKLAWKTETWSPAELLPEVKCYKQWEPPVPTPPVPVSGIQIPCADRSYSTLAELTVPDGRKYEFSYDLEGKKSWGALTRVRTPEGAVHRFEYGGPGLFSHPPISWLSADQCPLESQSGMGALIRRRLWKTHVYPSGESGPVYTTQVDHLAAPPAPHWASARLPLQWTRTTYPRGHFALDAVYAAGDSRYPVPGAGTPFASEKYNEDGSLVEANYYGNPGILSTDSALSAARARIVPPASRSTAVASLAAKERAAGRRISARRKALAQARRRSGRGLASSTGAEAPASARPPAVSGALAERVSRTPVGKLFLESETASEIRLSDQTGLVQIHGASSLDERHSLVLHYRDGVTWAEAFSYDPSDLPADGGKARTNGNVTQQDLLDSSGTVLRSTRTAHETDAEYLERNLLRLVRAQEVWSLARSSDPSSGLALFLDTRYAHDKADTVHVPSSQPGLDSDFVKPPYGWVTSKTVEAAQPSRSGASPDGQGLGTTPPRLSYAFKYYDDGSLFQNTDPLGVIAQTLEVESKLCSPEQRTLRSVVRNPLGHALETVRDCWTGETLSIKDSNGNLTCTQYDSLGRVVETAAPGDRLSALAAGIRDPQCPTTGGDQLGSGGRGPTTWVEYVSLGVPGQQRVLTYQKNGTAQGLYSKAFLDGKSRAIQKCQQVDPATHSGNVEVCTYKEVDDSGRTDVETAPFYQAAPSAAVSGRGGAGSYARTSFDVLGRPVHNEVVGSGLPPGSVQYASTGSEWVRTVLDPRGHLSETRTNLLGHVLEESRVSDTCEGGWCRTTYELDGAGQTLRIVSPRNARQSDGPPVDAGGHEVLFDYDGLGRRVAMLDPNLGLRLYGYDANAQRTSEKDAKGQLIELEYDALGRIRKKTLSPVPTGASAPEERAKESVVTYFYDGQGPLPPRDVVRWNPGPVRRGFERGIVLLWNALPSEGLLASAMEWVQPWVEGALSVEGASAPARIGKLTSSGNGLARRYYEYDALGRPTVETATLDGQTFKRWLTYGYPKGGAWDMPEGSLGTHVASETFSDGETLHYEYDLQGKTRALGARPARSGSVQPIVSGVSRNVRGAWIRADFGDETRVERVFDENRTWRLRSQRTTALRTGTVLQSESYGWDAVGNLTEFTDGLDPSGSYRYEYDSLERLTSATRSPDDPSRRLQLKYRYSGTGNLIHKAGQDFTYGAEGGRVPNAVTRAGGKTWSYDANGNLERTDSSLLGKVELVWNAENMPIELKRDAEPIQSKNFIGERLWRKREKPPGDPSRESVTLYPFGSYVIENGKARKYFSDWAERSTDGQLRFYHPDVRGSTTLVTQLGGAVVHRSSFLPWGEADKSQGGFTPRKKFHNREDEATGWYDYGARLYDPFTGRFISPDTDLEAGFNRYAYASNNPVSRIDPDGHQDNGLVKFNDWLNDFQVDMARSVFNGLMEEFDTIQSASIILQKLMCGWMCEPPRLKTPRAQYLDERRGHAMQAGIFVAGFLFSPVKGATRVAPALGEMAFARLAFKKIGAGSSQIAYRVFADGKATRWVLKTIKTEVEKSGYRFSKEAREDLAHKMVEYTEMVRKKFPKIVPETYKAGPGMLMQEFVDRTGKFAYDELPSSVRARAAMEVSDAIFEAEKATGLAFPNDLTKFSVDKIKDNFIFNADGTIYKWFDPIAAPLMPSK